MSRAKPSPGIGGGRHGLIAFFLSQGRQLLWGSAGAGVIGGMSSAAILVFINRSTSDSAGWTGATAPLMVFFGLLGIRLFASLASKLMLIKLGQRAVYELRLRIGHAVLGAPVLNLERTGQARILSAFTEDIPQVSNLIANLPVAGINAVVILACLGYMAWFSPMLTVFTLIFIAIGVTTYRFLMARGLRLFLETRGLEAGLLEDFKLLGDGAKELKLNRSRSDGLREGAFTRKAREARRRVGSAMSSFAFGDVWGEFLLLAPIGLALFLAQGMLRVPGETIREYVVTLIFLFGPLTALVVTLPLLGRSSASLRNLASLEGDLGAEEIPLAHGPVIGSLRPDSELELKAAEFHYPGGGFVVGPVDLRIRPGELVFLVGGNGSGKSTLAKMLLGLYPLSEGTLRLNGAEITADNLDWYRSHFAAVFSDSPLFRDIAAPRDSDIEVEGRRWLGRFGLEEKVAIAGGAFSEIRLSTGQRKRLSLISALLEDKPAYVLDEWAAEQDPPFRRTFYEEVLPELRRRGKLVVVITHDDRYFRLADRIVRMDYGKPSGRDAGGLSEIEKEIHTWTR